MKLLKTSKLHKLCLIVFIVYAICVFANQQSKLNSYKKEKAFYQEKIASLKDKQEDLVSTRENVNSPEYIEKIAREKLDMYMPNERVYIDVSK